MVFDPPDAEPGRGLRLEPRDCVVAKLYAGRPKDQRFAETLMGAGLVDPAVLGARIEALEEIVAAADRARMLDWVRARTR